jgi:hypothetical protein
MTYPVFTTGEILRAADMNAVGLWLVKSQTVGSGVSSVTVSDAFSAEYDNYLITYTNGTGSTLGDIRLQLGSTTANYNNQLLYGAYASTALAFGGTLSSFAYIGGSDTSEANIEVTLQCPFLTKQTKCFARYANTAAAVTFGGILTDSTSYTAFTIIPSAGTITGGQINVYGFRKA